MEEFRPQENTFCITEWIPYTEWKWVRNVFRPQKKIVLQNEFGTKSFCIIKCGHTMCTLLCVIRMWQCVQYEHNFLSRLILNPLSPKHQLLFTGRAFRGHKTICTDYNSVHRMKMSSVRNVFRPHNKTNFVIQNEFGTKSFCNKMNSVKVIL